MEHTSNHCVVITTTDSDELTERISTALVSKNLAACVQKLDIASIYKWEGKVAKDKEQLVLIKTRTDLIDKVEAIISEIHTYDVPEIICMPIFAGSESYLGWIDLETSQS